MILIIAVVVLVIAADQATKYIMAGLLPGLPERSLPVIRDVLHFTYVENQGAAFGMLSDKRWVFMILSVLGLAAIAVLLFKEKPQSAWVRFAASLVLGGGIGNMIDRLGFGFAEQKGAVVDFIDCRFVDFYVFNVADSCVTVGCFLYLILIVASEIRAAKEKQNAEAAPAEGTSPAGPASAEGTESDSSAVTSAAEKAENENPAGTSAAEETENDSPTEGDHG